MKKRICFYAIGFFLLLAQIRPAAAGGSIDVIRVADEASEPQYTLKTAYPKIQGMINRDAQSRLNILFAEEAESLTVAVETAAKRGNRAEGMLDFKVMRNCEGYLSISTERYLDTGGNTNGNCSKSGVTIGVTDGRVKTLSDLFIQDVDYVALINGEIKRQIQEEGLKDAEIKAFHSIAHTQEFYLTDHELVILFEQGQYFPHSMGVPEFPVQLEKIKELLVPGVLPSS